jgi:hypothetical protein
MTFVVHRPRSPLENRRIRGTAAARPTHSIGIASVVFGLAASGGACGLSKVGLGPDDTEIDGGAAVERPRSTPDAPTTSDGELPVGPAVESGGARDAEPIDAQEDPEDGTCDFNGTWGIRLSVDVTWVPQGLTGVILAPGAGRIRQWIRSTWTVTGNSLTEAATICGIALPDFSSTQASGSETYGIRFPDSLFDNGYIAGYTTHGILGGPGQGFTYTSDPVAVLMGLTLSSPLDTPWPSTITTAVDSDQDGKPGVTADVVEDAGYSEVAVDLLKTRADRVYLAIRQVSQVTATRDDCDHFSGSVQIPQIPPGSSGKPAIDSHVIGCRLAGSGLDCSALQSGFVDATQPVFSPSGPSDFRATRLAPDAVCATVRQRLP